MNADEAVVALVRVLESLAIPYMVSGSLATNVYGVPRATDDGDFVLELPPGGRIADIAGALPEAIRLEPQVPFETVTTSQLHVCTVADSAFHRHEAEEGNGQELANLSRCSPQSPPAAASSRGHPARGIGRSIAAALRTSGWVLPGCGNGSPSQIEPQTESDAP